MKKSVICGFVRSPFTPAFKGSLAKVRPDDLAAQTIKALIAKTGIRTKDIEDLILGCAFPEGEQGLNLARLVGFIADLPKETGGLTINRFCGSSMEAVHIAVGKIAIGAGDVFICAGVESMSRIPMGGYNFLPNPKLYEEYPEAYISMGITAENVAKKCGVSRAEQEEFACLSHKKAVAADFSEEVISINGVNKDGCIRPDNSPEILAELKPVFLSDGIVTAGTSSPLTDGASAVLIASEDYAKTNNLPILAHIKATAIIGNEPEIMGLAPVGAIRKVLERAELSIADIDLFEINEAFAAQAISCVRELSIDMAKVNLHGGAIAIGHPLGASGARIIGKAASLLASNSGRYAVSAMCIGGGQGIATVISN